LDSIPAGYAPVENPIAFDPTTYIVGPHGIGASFVNVPIAGSMTDSTTNAVGTRDIALITRDPDDGHLVLDGCYILLEYGNAACDENEDGQITYKDVPVGTYTVHQTQTPGGYPTAPDFAIRVDGPYPDVPLGYVVRQATQQVSLGSRNVSVVFVDSRTHAKVESNICVELVGGTEAACDDALVDGQIDFLDVQAGTYPIDFSGLPTGWQILTDDVIGPTVTIESSPGKPSIQFVYFEVYVPDSASTATSSGSQNSSVSTGSAGSSESTWTADVWVRLCDVPPSSASEYHCSGGAGVVVSVSLASGEFLGSCTTSNPYITPGGYTISTCMVPGLPFNANFVATQDLSTIPAGYEPVSNTLTFSIGNERRPVQLPQDVDGRTPDVDFVDVPVAIGSSSPPGSNASAGATLLMTFRGCPEGFDPNIDDPYANCTIPLDAPDASLIIWGGDGQGGMNITGLDRQYDGAYIYNAGPPTMNVHLGRLAPVVRDDYQVIGADSVDGDSYTINLSDGETREVFIFYYFYP
jgi:hypothetical protein